MQLTTNPDIATLAQAYFRAHDHYIGTRPWGPRPVCEQLGQRLMELTNGDILQNPTVQAALTAMETYERVARNAGQVQAYHVREVFLTAIGQIV